MKLGVLFASKVEDGEISHDGKKDLDIVTSLYKGGAIDHILAVGGWNIRMKDGSKSVAEALASRCKEQGIEASWRGASSDTIGNIRVDLVDFCVHKGESDDMDIEEIHIIGELCHLRRIRLILYGLKLPVSVSVKSHPSRTGFGYWAGLKECVLLVLTWCDPEGRGFLWRFLRGLRRKKRQQLRKGR